MQRLHDKTQTEHKPPSARRASFARSEDGSLIIFGLMMFVLMLMVGGLAVDFMRFEAQRTRLQSTLDRAVLAAASLDQELDPQDVVLDYFQKAGLGAYIDREDITVEEDAFSRRVDASVDMNVNSTFLNFVGISNLVAPGRGAAEEATSLTEISLVVDVSGSMGSRSYSGRSKIEELRRAARKFVNIVMCDPANPDSTTNCTVEPGTVSVSLVPYAEQVLVGDTILSKLNATDEHDYSSCVTFDASDFNTTAINKGTPLQRTGHFDPWSRWDRTPRSWTCATDSWREITPISGDISTLHNRINALGASGNTSIDVGMKWGSALLDPAFQPVTQDLVNDGVVDSDFEERPNRWTKRGLEKVIVLMTDGVNTSQHYLYDAFRDGPSPVYRDIRSDGTLGDHYSVYDADNDRYYWDNTGTWEDHAFGTGGTYEQCGWTYSWWSGWTYDCTQVEEGNGAEQLSYPDLWKEKTWDWYDRFSWLNTQGSAYGNSIKNTRLQTMCNTAKAEGMTIFTIGFEVTSSSASVMRDCASTPGHYFDANGLNLADAFSAIAREISKLRLIN